MYTKLTGGWMGASEMILATAWCGIVYALIGGQPMMINGGTGPVLAFANVIYELSVSLEVPFLTLNAWVGIWVGVYMLVAALVDLNRFIHMCTRFTDEVFAGLISAIFIVNALGSPTSSVGVFHYFDDLHPSHEPYRNVTTPPRVNGSADSGSDGELSGEATFHGWLGEYSHYASALLAVDETANKAADKIKTLGVFGPGAAVSQAIKGNSVRGASVLVAAGSTLESVSLSVVSSDGAEAASGSSSRAEFPSGERSSHGDVKRVFAADFGALAVRADASLSMTPPSDGSGEWRRGRCGWRGWRRRRLGGHEDGPPVLVVAEVVRARRAAVSKLCQHPQ